MKHIGRILVPAAIAVALLLGGTAQAQDKKALATKLAQIQVELDGQAMAEQLTLTAVGPLVAKWLQRVETTVPEDKQRDVTQRLDVELEKLGQSTEQLIMTQLQATAQAALVPIYMENLTEDELKMVITWLESSASTKLQTLNMQATEAWAQKIVDQTEPQVKNKVDAFEASAIGIVGVSGKP